MLADDALAHGADRYLEKGVHPDAIIAAIEEVATRALTAGWLRSLRAKLGAAHARDRRGGRSQESGEGGI